MSSVAASEPSRMPPAIYLDFETLRQPPTPAILGILTDDEQGTRFEQVILDERLHPGAVARADLRTAALTDVVSGLLDCHLPLVAWSNFDRNVILGLVLPSALKAAFADRYVNALTDARTWRTRVRPSIKIVRASAKDPRHTLDQYAAATGYASAGALNGAEPAKWIRHLLQQLASKKNYRRVTKQAKRDWHKLLEYNRYDCFALRHVHLKASFELQKWREYDNTTYCVTGESGGEACFRVGSPAQRLNPLLERYGAHRWGVSDGMESWVDVAFTGRERSATERHARATDGGRFSMFRRRGTGSGHHVATGRERPRPGHSC